MNFLARIGELPKRESPERKWLLPVYRSSQQMARPLAATVIGRQTSAKNID
jgi:hypothetical protein